MTHRYRLGVDVGGTFTDGILIDEKTGETRIAKVPSTPSDPSVGFLEAVERILGEAGIEASDVGYLVHGTTVATNAIIEGKAGADRLHHHRRVPGHAGDPAPDSPLPLRPALREAAPPRAPVSMLRYPGAARCDRRRRHAAGRAGGRRRGRPIEEGGCGSARGVLPPCLPQLGTRAAHARDRARGLPRSGGLALLRGGAGVPGVLPGPAPRSSTRACGPSSSDIYPTSRPACGIRAWRGNCWSCRAAAAS